MKWQTSEPPWGERRAADTASEGELWWREADGLEVFLFWRLVITTLRETGGGEERIITRAPSPSDRRVGGEKKWKSQISSTSWRGAMTGKAKHYYTFPLCGRNERTQRARRFLPPFVSELLSSFSSSLVSFHLFLFVFVCLCWYFLSFPSLQRSVCLPLPPPSLPPWRESAFPGYSGQLQLKMTKWRSSVCHRIKWNVMAHEKKPTYASVHPSVCVCVCVYCMESVCVGSGLLLTVSDICPPQYAQVFWVNHPQMQSEGVIQREGVILLCTFARRHHSRHSSAALVTAVAFPLCGDVSVFFFLSLWNISKSCMQLLLDRHDP